MCYCVFLGGCNLDTFMVLIWTFILKWLDSFLCMILMILDTILVFVFFDGLDTFVGLILSYERYGLDSFLVLI